MGLCSAILELWRAECRKHSSQGGPAWAVGPPGRRECEGHLPPPCTITIRAKRMCQGFREFGTMSACSLQFSCFTPNTGTVQRGVRLCLLHKYDEEEDLQAAQDIKPFCAQITHVVSYTAALASVSSCCWMLTRLPPRLWLA